MSVLVMYVWDAPSVDLQSALQYVVWLIFLRRRQGKDAIYQRWQPLAARLLLFCPGRLGK